MLPKHGLAVHLPQRDGHPEGGEAVARPGGRSLHTVPLLWKEPRRIGEPPEQRPCDERAARVADRRGGGGARGAVRRDERERGGDRRCGRHDSRREREPRSPAPDGEIHNEYLHRRGRPRLSLAAGIVATAATVAASR